MLQRLPMAKNYRKWIAQSDSSSTKLYIFIVSMLHSKIKCYNVNKCYTSYKSVIYHFKPLYTKKCRLCVGDVGEDTIKYNVNYVWINIYLVEQIGDTPNFATEHKTNFPKLICDTFFNKMYRHKAAIKNTERI